MNQRQFKLLITGLLCIILGINIIIKHYYPNEVLHYILDTIFFIIFGIGISDLIKRVVITQK